MKVRYIFIHIYIYIYIYIYIVEKYIQLYIVYDIQEPLGILLKWEHNGGWGGQLGLLGGAAPIVFQLLIRGMSLLVLARIGVRVTGPGRRRICGSIVFGQNALMPMVQGLEGRPLWGRAVYTALHGARLSSVPSGDQSANPASVLGHSGLQRAVLSVSSAQKCSGDGRLATPSGVSRAARSAVPCRSSVPGHRASRSKYTRGQSQETGSRSKSSGGVGALAKRVLLGPAWADSGSLVFLRDDAGLRTVVSNRRLLRQSWCYSPGLMRAGPSGEERCTPHYTVLVSPQCPQEISRLTLPVFQGAAVSSERFSQSLPLRNVAELGGSPPLRGSLEQLGRPSPAGPPLQGTELAALSTPEASLKRLVPLVGHPAAWEPLPSVSHWDLPEQTLVPSLP